jgi:catechol 2,3-dioxygenase-like lactoylglutathione lyase family enzyme
MKMTKIVPMLPVKSMPASVDFYTKMLGFKVIERNDNWRWASLGFDDCRLMIDESINTGSGRRRDAIFYLYPDNIVEYHATIRTNGLKIPDLNKTFYGLTEFRIEDPDGNLLWIGQETG